MTSLHSGDRVRVNDRTGTVRTVATRRAGPLNLGPALLRIEMDDGALEMAWSHQVELLPAGRPVLRVVEGSLA